MGKVMRNVVSGNDRSSHVTSTSPLTRHAAALPDPGPKGSKVASTSPRTRRASPIDPPNNSTHRFKMSDAQMSQPQSVVELGKGAIPVPVGSKAASKGVALLRDSAPRR